MPEANSTCIAPDEAGQTFAVLYASNHWQPPNDMGSWRTPQ